MDGPGGFGFEFHQLVLEVFQPLVDTLHPNVQFAVVDVAALVLE